MIEGKIDAVYMGYNEFVNTMTQKPMIQQLLPLIPSEEDRNYSRSLGLYL